MVYTVKGLDGFRYQLSLGDVVSAEIRMPTKTWPCKGTFSEGCGSTAAHFPALDLAGKSYRFLRELTNPKDFHPNHRVWAELEDGTELIAAQCKPGKTSILNYQGSEYALHSDARFFFRFRLLQGQGVLAAFRETTKFWTFSARKDYRLDAYRELDPLLLCFAFLVSICRY